jgi:hypothetical protein
MLAAKSVRRSLWTSELVAENGHPERGITSSIHTVSSQAALCRIALRQYDLLETRSAPKSACTWADDDRKR